MPDTPPHRLTSWPRVLLAGEGALWASGATSAFFLSLGASWLGDIAHPIHLWLSFAWLFSIILWSAMAVVRHADCLAIQLGEPYGTLILTLSVVSIEIVTISSLMLTSSQGHGLARDTMYGVLMIVLNGMVGLCLVLGGLRHKVQHYNLQGANAFLAVIVPLSILGLVLPNYTMATAEPELSVGQSIFFVTLCLGMYCVFLIIQTTRHRTDFTEPEGVLSLDADKEERGHQSVFYHAVLLLAYLALVVVLADKLAIPVDHFISVLGVPEALGGLMVAILVCSPEAVGAVRAAMANRLQRAVNISLGSALATISLTIPAVLLVALYTDKHVILGLGSEAVLMLVTTLLVSLLTFGAGRTTVLQGAVHLLLFLVYIMLIFDLPTFSVAAP